MEKATLLIRRSDVGSLNGGGSLVGAVIKDALSLRKALSETKARLVHTNSLKACVIGGISARLAGLRVVWQIHSVISPAKGLRPSAVRIMQQLGKWLPDAIVCNSQVTASCFPGNLRVSVIPCGVAPMQFHPNGHKRGRRIRVGMIARFSAEKGQDVLLGAVERLLSQGVDMELVLAGTALFGEAAYEAAIHERAGAPPLAARVSLPGFVDDVPSLLNGFDIVVHPSVEPEGFGQSVVEAMMAGKPVVVSAAGGSAELVEDGVTGLLVPPGDSIALAAAIDRLARQPEFAAQMAKRAREVAIERYDIAKTTKAIENVWERVLAEA